MKIHLIVIQFLLSLVAHADVPSFDSLPLEFKALVQQQEKVECSEETKLDAVIEDVLKKSDTHALADCNDSVTSTTLSTSEVCPDCTTPESAPTPVSEVATAIENSIFGKFCVSNNIIYIKGATLEKNVEVNVRFIVDWINDIPGGEASGLKNLIDKFKAKFKEVEENRYNMMVAKYHISLDASASEQDKLDVATLEASWKFANEELQKIKSDVLPLLASKKDLIQSVLQTAAEKSNKIKTEQEAAASSNSLVSAAKSSASYKSSSFFSTYPRCGISVIEYSTTRYYTDSGYGAVNSGLRSEPKQPSALEYAAIAARALRSFQSFMGPVRRGSGPMPQPVMEQHKEGNVVHYGAFTSTSTRHGFNGQYRMLIFSRNGRYVNGLSGHSGESEVLFPAGTDFIIHRKNETNYGYNADFVMEESVSGQDPKLKGYLVIPKPSPSPEVSPTPMQ